MSVFSHLLCALQQGMQHKKFLLATFPVHVTFIGIEVTKFLL